MTVQLAFKVTRTNRKFNKGDQIVAKLRRALHSQVKPVVKKRFLIIVANWEHKVQFPTDNIDTADVIGFFIHPGKGRKASQIYAWVTEGTPAHQITGSFKTLRKRKGEPSRRLASMRPGSLAFQVGYNPKTRPVGQFGGPGTHYGPWVNPIAVDHPGITPRRFEESVARDTDPWFQATMQAEWRNAIRTV